MKDEEPPKLWVYFADRISNAAKAEASPQLEDEHAPQTEGSEQKIAFNVRDQDYESIWSMLKKATGAQDVPPTEDEVKELHKLEEMNERSAIDRQRNADIRQKKKDQELMLQQARGEVEMLRQI